MLKKKQTTIHYFVLKLILFGKGSNFEQIEVEKKKAPV